jgi:hypothetical protein
MNWAGFEETYFTFSASPVRDDRRHRRRYDCVETTGRVIGERRWRR